MAIRTSPPPSPPRPAPRPAPTPEPAVSKPAPAPAPAPAKESTAPTKSEAQEAIRPPVKPLPKPHDRTLGHGKEHGMVPLKFPDPSKIKSFDDLTNFMGETTAAGRDLGKAVEVFKAMIADKKCFRVITLSGNVTPLNRLVAELIDRKIINAVVSTGSICTHSFSVERGRPMFKIDDPDAVDDNWMYAKGYNRIYDCIELEDSLNEGFDILREITDSLDPAKPVASADITRMLGEHLNENFPKEDGLLHAAARNDIPIFIPSFSDCEIGLDFYAQNVLREKEGSERVMFDAFEDWQQYADLIKAHKDSCGILTLGGGAPRNWAQQVGPSFDILTEYGAEPKELLMRFKYGIRICDASPANAGLSGCSYNEGRSWGKFWPEKEEVGEGDGPFGMNAEIIGDYTLALPILVAAVLEGTK